jgi:peroxin-3
LIEPSRPRSPDQEEQTALAAAAAREQDQTLEEEIQQEDNQEDSLESNTPDNQEGSILSPSGRPRRPNEHQQQPPVLLDPTGNANSSALDASAHLQHHYDSIQQIADATTLPSLLLPLSRALAAADGIDASLERLRSAKGGTISLSSEEKQRLWQDLSGAALGRLIASIWSLSLLSLQVRVQLNVLGRHLYLEAALHDATSSGSGGGGVGGGGFGGAFRDGGLSRLSGGARPPPKLSAPSQESFLSFAEYLTNVGHVKLLALTRKAADAALVGVSLDQKINSEELGVILSRSLALFTQDILGGRSMSHSGIDSASTSTTASVVYSDFRVGGWIEFLLPPPQELREMLRVKKPDDRAMLPGAHDLLVDVDAVHAMVEEVGCILSSERFQHVGVGVARYVSKRAASGLGERIGQGIALPLARLVPLIVAEAKSMLAARGEAAVAIATMPEVAALCATVYSCGPPL